jgi:hypothetical protein
MKFWLWISTGLDAFLLCIFAAIRMSDIRIGLLGAVAMVLQVLHGVRVAFFNKTLVNMSIGFCKFQFYVLAVCSVIIALEMGGIFGIILVAASISELIVALTIPKRRDILEFLRERFPV